MGVFLQVMWWLALLFAILGLLPSHLLLFSKPKIRLPKDYLRLLAGCASTLLSILSALLLLRQPHHITWVVAITFVQFRILGMVMKDEIEARRVRRSRDGRCS